MVNLIKTNFVNDIYHQRHVVLSPQKNVKPESSLLKSSRPQIDRMLKEHVSWDASRALYLFPVLIEGWLFPLPTSSHACCCFQICMYLSDPRSS